jgi:serine phosphatase RsbU (regulator of sigma subunit)
MNSPTISKRRANIAKTIYPLRVVGYWLAIASIVFHHWHRYGQISVLVQVVSCIFLLYPHLAFLIAQRKKQDHVKAEFWNLTFDLFLIAWIGYLLDFSLMSALPFLFANSATIYSVGGLRTFLRGWLAWLVAMAIILLAMPLGNIDFYYSENLAALLPAVLYSFAATHYIALISYHRGTSLIRTKRQMEEQNLSLKEQKEELLVLNEEIRQQNEEIVSQRDFIEEQNRSLESKNAIIEKSSQEIMASIAYAKRIQEAILPEMRVIQKWFPQSFVFYRPRDIVSGDFYWIAEKNYKIIVAAVDCTGHGIPGALMSMIGNELLNDIVKSRNITEPDKILHALRRGIIETLRQEEGKNQDGLDIALCSIDAYPKEYQAHLGSPKLCYAGVGNALVYVQQGQLHEIRPNRLMIGGLRGYRDDQKFEQHTIDIAEDTVIYLFSDGFQDQFGGHNDRKFSSKRFKELLFKIHSLPMEEQGQVLAQSLDDWMQPGAQKQVDDIMVLGLRVGGI